MTGVQTCALPILHSNGWDINNYLFKEYALYFRNALVLSNYANIKEKISPDFSYLKGFFDKLLFNNELELENIKPVPATNHADKER